MFHRFRRARRTAARLRMAGVAVMAVSIVAVIACGSDDEPAVAPTQAPAPTAAPEPTSAPSTPGDAMLPEGAAPGGDLIIPLGPLNDSGQTGIAMLREIGSQTEIVIAIGSGAAGVPQPIHVHSGTCADLGGVDFPLENVVDGGSTSLIDTPLSGITGGANAINVHLSGDEAGTYVACGDIPAGDSFTTVALGELNGSGQTGAATLIANGAQTTVVVSASDSAAAQPIHVHTGSCDNLGGVEHPLTNAIHGISVTTVDASKQSLLDGDFAINLHESADNAGNYTACGDLSASSDGDAMMADSEGDVIVSLGELNSSGQTGIATLRDKGAQTEVVINISAGAAGVPQPIHVHAGSCADLGGVDFPLENVVDGHSVSLIDTPLSAILGGGNSINVHLSGDEAGTYVACGDLPDGDASVTIALGALNDSGQPGSATLIADGSQTNVIVNVSSGPAGVAQPIHIHTGTCDNLGGVEHGLTSLVDGVSLSSVDAALQSLIDGEFAINLHESADNAGNYTACGDIS